MAENTIKFKIKIDDEGNLSVVGKKAKAAAQSFNEVAQGSRNADRNIKGAAQASSNASKNFSKMSQGMGGLVGAYASLAAQIFAISAAFNFLKSAGDLKVLQASQQAYASSTGLSMRVLANDIVAATDAQINFTEASQAAAIGTAAGLNPAQLKELGTAARNLSVTLGRDVTDSFNRLVRGVTKAEPELLDELGIILRLDDANEEYARKLGKTASELTQFERSQAVVNKVLEETQRVAAVAPPDVNPYNQLAKAFDDILNQIKLVTDAIAGPLAKVLTDTPELAIASFLLLLKGPLAALGINFGNIAKNARESANAQALAAQKAKAAYESTKITIQSTTAAIREQAAAAVAAGSSSKILQQFGSGGVMTPQARATLKRALDAAEKNVDKHSKVVKGIFKGMDIAIVRDFQLAMAQLETAEKSKVTGTQKNVAALVSFWTTGMAGIKAASAWMLTWGTRLLNALGWIGIAVTGFQLLSNYMGWFKKDVDETNNSLQETRKRFEELNKEFEDFVKKQKELTGAGRGQEVFGNIGRMLSMTTDDQFLQAVKDYSRQRELLRVYRGEAARAAFAGNKDLENLALSRLQEVRAGATNISRLLQATVVTQEGMGQSKALNALQALIKSGEATEEQLLNARNAVIEFGAKVSELRTLIKDSDDTTSDWLQSMAPISGGEKAINAINRELKQYEDIAAGLVEGEAGLTQEQRDRLGTLQNNLKIIEQAEDRIHEAKLRSIGADRAAEAALRNIQQELLPIQNNLIQQEKLKNSIADRNAEIQTLNNIQELNNEQTRANKRRVEELEALNALDEQRLRYAREDYKIENQIYILKIKLKDARLYTEELNFVKQIVSLKEKDLQFSKDLLNVDIERQRLRLAGQQRRFQATSALSSTGRERILAQQTFDLEASLIASRVESIRLEFEGKRAQAQIENEIAKTRLEVSEIELRNRAAVAGIDEEERERLESLANGTAALASQIQSQLGSQLELLDAKELLALEQVADSFQEAFENINNLEPLKVLGTEVKNNLRQGVAEGLKDLFTKSESSFKQAIAKIVTGLLDTVAENAANSLADLIFSSQSVITGAATLGGGIVTGARSAATILATAIRNAITSATAAIRQSSTSSQSGQSGGGDFLSNVFGSLISSQTGGSPFSAVAGNFLSNVFGSLLSPRSLTNSAANSAATSVAASMGVSSPAQFFTSAMSGQLGSGFRFANGGMVKGGFRAYASGGVVSNPTLGLVGEGRYNEAIVPLPNGKAIPVDMKGSGQNNVTVNVSVDGSGGTSMQQSSAQAGDLGKAIARAVQQELQNQKRSGGILSPYGAA